jgi:hypothetical protein
MRFVKGWTAMSDQNDRGDGTGPKARNRWNARRF